MLSHRGKTQYGQGQGRRLFPRESHYLLTKVVLEINKLTLSVVLIFVRFTIS